MIRCESCSAEIGELSLHFVRGEMTRGEWFKEGYQLVVAHHPDWPLQRSWEYVRVRAPFYPFGDPARHRYPGEKVAPPA